jgi:hypothetical protein
MFQKNPYRMPILVSYQFFENALGGRLGGGVFHFLKHPPSAPLTMEGKIPMLVVQSNYIKK